MNDTQHVGRSDAPDSRHRWVLAAAIAVYALFVTAYALVTPVFEGFDAQAHYAAATFYRAERRLPELTPATVADSYELITQPPLYHALAGLAALGWPVEEARSLAQESTNLYFDKSLSYRQSVVLPGASPAALAPAWIARFVSALGGLLTLLCTWWLARTLFPRRQWLALAAVAVAVLNPQFLYTSVSITNDAWSAGMAALALATAAHAALNGSGPRAWLWAGLALALAGLTKYSALLVAVPMGIFWLAYWRRQGWRAALSGALWAAGAFVLIAGWWFARNLWLYGEIVPFERMAAVLPTMRRAVPYDLARTLAHAPWLVASFWGVFVAIIAPPWYLDATRWLMIGGLAGLVPALRFVRRARDGLSLVYLALLPWLAIVALSVLYWTQTVEYGEQGRLAHIGASAFGVTMAVGWAGWLPARWRSLAHGLLVAAMIAAAAAGFVVLRDAFALPPAAGAMAAPQRALDARFDGGMRVVGVDFPAGAAVAPGSTLPVTLYFTTDAPIAEDYTLFLHLAGEGDELLYQFDGVAQAGRHPTRQWVPGMLFADRYDIPIPATASPQLATLSLGFYPAEDANLRRPLIDASGQVLGDRLVLAPVRIVEPGQGAPAAAPPLARFDNGITLLGAQLQSGEDGMPAGVSLTWGTTTTLHSDYTVFVQVLDAENRILAQVDQQPQEGQSPTSTWRAGDVVQDAAAWTADTSGWARVIVGLYGADGVRLGVVEPVTLPDAVQIATASGP
ncbi:MAG TPA: glycosyltransferase family 39 protein [Caldilinea sp.]|nr:glycosyltransferase family 39 protein [Caldilinea sp.]